MRKKVIVGAKETIDLPELGLFAITTRIDTGAQTTALHADHMLENEETGMIDFEFHPDSHDINKTIRCSAKIIAQKRIKSSNGDREQRYIINSKAIMGSLEWTIRISLTNRSRMNHLLCSGAKRWKGILL